MDTELDTGSNLCDDGMPTDYGSRALLAVGLKKVKRLSNNPTTTLGATSPMRPTCWKSWRELVKLFVKKRKAQRRSAAFATPTGLPRPSGVASPDHLPAAELLAG